MNKLCLTILERVQGEVVISALLEVMTLYRVHDKSSEGKLAIKVILELTFLSYSVLSFGRLVGRPCLTLFPGLTACDETPAREVRAGSKEAAYCFSRFLSPLQTPRALAQGSVFLGGLCSVRALARKIWSKVNGKSNIFMLISSQSSQALTSMG